jgi:hypothetical protein
MTPTATTPVSPLKELSLRTILVSALIMVGSTASVSIANARLGATMQSGATAQGSNYQTLIPSGTKSSKSYFDIHEVNGRTLFEIPSNMLGRDILWTVERGSEGTAAPSNLSAKTTSSIMVRWEKINNKLFIRNLSSSLARRSDTTPFGNTQQPTSDQKIPPMQRAVAESSIAPTMVALNILTTGPRGSLVVDMTDVFLADLPELELSKAFGASRVDPSRSYIESVRAFPRNTLVTSYITAAPANGSASLSATIKHNLTLLPDVPMRPRAFDKRVGLFTVDFEQYSEDSNAGVVNQSYIRRYRLEKKNPGAAMSEPVKPIVYYVGRTIPKKWRPYVRQGIEDWQVAFEAAGFKNAIIAKDAPTEAEDPNWDPGDTRHSVIRWIANPIMNAIGPNIVDPRTGEILSAHILLWEDVLKFTNAWYYTMCSGVDPAARTWPLSEEITGRMLRYAVAHEVGHSMGLRHNHRASTAYTVAQLRDKEFTAKYGSTASIMAYGRMNYVAQPEDGIPPESLMPKIGPYDVHAIRWAYAPLTQAQEATQLDKWASETATNPLLVWGAEDFAAMVDPRVLTQNVGKERVEATRLGMLNLKRAMSYLVKAVEAKNKDYGPLYDAWVAVLACRHDYLESVSKEIGGREEFRSTVGAGRQFNPVSLERQKAAVQYLLDEGLNWDPVYLSPDVLNNAIPFNVTHELRKYQGGTLAGMFTPMKLIQLSDSAVGGQNPYSLTDYLQDVTTGVFSEASGTKEPSLLRRSLHRQFFHTAESQFTVNMTQLASLYQMVGAPTFIVEALSSSLETEYKIALKLALRGLEAKLDAAAKSAKDPALALHWSECLNSTRRLLAR